MKSYMKYFFKIILAGVVAFVILSAFTTLFYNIPSRIDAPGGASDYAWKQNTFYSRGTEGFAWGKTDKNGYNNVNVPEKIDILLLGSSHMEAFNVMQNENAIFKLNDMLSDSNLNFNAYNIGISGHTIEKCLNNLENAVNEFNPTKYVIIETVKTKLNSDSLEKLIEGSLQKTSYNTSSITNKLSSLSYFRLIYKQINGNKDDDKKAPDISHEKYANTLNTVLKNAAQAVGKNRKLIIALSTNLVFDKNQNIKERDKNYYYNTLKRLCEENNIIFIDTYDAYVDYYNKNHILPHGFTNSKVGEGHLNKYGHSIFANELYKAIVENEVK